MKEIDSYLDFWKISDALAKQGMYFKLDVLVPIELMDRIWKERVSRYPHIDKLPSGYTLTLYTIGAEFTLRPKKEVSSWKRRFLRLLCLLLRHPR